MWSSGSGAKESFAYDSFGRVMRINEHPVRTDKLGRIVLDHRGNLLQYDSADRLVRVQLPSLKQMVVYRYDYLGRLVARVSGNTTMQFFYADRDSPYQVTHVYRPLSGHLTSLGYDDRGRLLFVDDDVYGESYVMCDSVGSPILIFSDGGHLMREVSRTPYGEILYDSKRSMGEQIAIGFAGGIQDEEDVGLVHIQVGSFTSTSMWHDNHSFVVVIIQGLGGSRAYDPSTSSFLAPRWIEVPEEPLKLKSLLDAYRWPGADPVNLHEAQAVKGTNLLSGSFLCRESRFLPLLSRCSPAKCAC